ncbi:MAG TPA: 2-oxo-4-hydroxy-4-carboxy-5-ureidoimidazoline decarboxylase [Puia sp.]|nr:2-oxo-4-hydroxy-4-carboxy-5-ureidoimidazoline decarboxylase [Puia sp.]
MTLEELNWLDEAELSEALWNCCGSSAWVAGMMELFPVGSATGLYAVASLVWRGCSEEDWLEAFGAHPKIGERVTGAAAAEQAGTSGADSKVLQELSEGNKKYFEKFGYIFIVCATGKSAVEMLGLLIERLGNAPEEEILIAMEEQEKITRIRLEKLLS